MRLEVRGLVVVDRTGRRIVDGLDLAAAPGEIVALVGPSGAGKTTALRALLGALPDGLRIAAGTVTGDGSPLRPGPGARRWRRRHCGVLGQDPRSALHPLRGARTIVAEALTTGADTAVDEAMRSVGLDPGVLGDRRPHELSVGQAQRVALARALVAEPALLVLDEPTSGLDPAALRVVIEAVQARRSGVTLLVSHDAELVAQLAHRTVRLGPPRAAPARPRPSPPPGPAVLTVNGLDLAHPGTPLLRSARLAVHAGELVAILGPSGCGKSTLLRAVAGLHPVASGELRVGADAVPWPVRERSPAALRAVALVGQSPLEVLNPARRTRSALLRPLRTLRGLDRTAARAQADRLMADVGLAPELLDRFPSALSGGQRQRVALARALAGHPAVLLADEVTAALDDDTTAHVLDLLDKVRATGTGVLLVTHEPAVAARADRVLTLADEALRG
jgi:peptide/nickel transport system ATP-binding protein